MQHAITSSSFIRLNTYEYLLSKISWRARSGHPMAVLGEITASFDESQPVKTAARVHPSCRTKRVLLIKAGQLRLRNTSMSYLWSRHIYLGLRPWSNLESEGEIYVHGTRVTCGEQAVIQACFSSARVQSGFTHGLWIAKWPETIVVLLPCSIP